MKLTNRQNDVFNLLVKGMSTQEIADALYVTDKCVKGHITAIFEKYSVKSRAKLIANHYMGLLGLPIGRREDGSN